MLRTDSAFVLWKGSLPTVSSTLYGHSSVTPLFYHPDHSAWQNTFALLLWPDFAANNIGLSSESVSLFLVLLMLQWPAAQTVFLEPFAALFVLKNLKSRGI